MVKLPEFMNRVIAFVGAEAGHQVYADHLRERITVSPERREANINEFMLSAWGPYDSNANEEDWAARSDLERSYRTSLEEADRYLWGLAIAGIYHRWEIEVVSIIRALTSNKILKKNNPRFSDIEIALRKLGFNLQASQAYEVLCRTRLISNTIKHGSGDSFSKLRSEHPSLFGMSDSSGARPHDILLDAAHFDAAVGAITTVWNEFESAWQQRRERGQSGLADDE
jgi:hypothetical protein